jgi:hypothetical protein
MVVIPGVEFTKNSFSHNCSAHILALGIQKYIDPDLSIKSICKEVRRQGGINIAAHPVSTKRLESQTYYLWNNQDYYRPFLDAWEVASGPWLFELVLNSNLPKIANSDFHRRHHFESWKTIIEKPLSQSKVIEDIVSQNIGFYFYKECKDVVQRSCSTQPQLATGSAFRPLQASFSRSSHFAL